MISKRRKLWRSSRNLGARPTEAADEEAKEEAKEEEEEEAKEEAKEEATEEEGRAGWEDSYVLSTM
jgi:hypothetical protein